MSLESTALAEPLAGDHPAGIDCGEAIGTQGLVVLRNYLVECQLQKARDRLAERPGMDEGEKRLAAMERDDGRRQLAGFEEAAQSVLGMHSIGPEQVAREIGERAALLLREQGKDLRVVAFLAGARAWSDGLEGYASGVRLAAALVAAYPESLHPMPDPDDKDGPWARANAVVDLLHGAGTLCLLAAATVIETPSHRVAVGDLVGGLRADVPMARIPDDVLAQAVGEFGPARTSDVLRVLAQLDADARALARAFAGNLPSSRPAPLASAAARIQAAAGVPDEASPVDAAGASPCAGAAPESSAARAPRSREDARRILQDVIRFMEALEPGHPAPLLLKRADRLLGMSFVEIIRDIAPAALSEVEKLAGAAASK